VIRGLRLLRTAARTTMLAIMVVTALAAVAWAPSAPLDAKSETTMAPLRQAEPGLVAAIAERVAGGPGVVTVFDYEILDPMVALVGVIAVPSSALRVLAGVAIPIALTVLLGRVFCGYLCPVGWLATTLAWLRRRLHPWAGPGRGTSWPALALLGGVILMALAGLSSGVLLLLHIQAQRLAMAPLDGEAVFLALGALVAFVGVELIAAPGAWCRSLCPSGALYDLLAVRRRIGVLNTGTRPCPDNCHRCDEVCWLHLTPRSGDAGRSCDLCLSCAAVCPQKRLHPRPVRAGPAIVITLLAGSMAACTEATPPQLDDKPPWSTKINRLDGEVWQRTGEHEAGLSVAFLEAREDGDLYLFAAALWTHPNPPSAQFELESAAGRATLTLAGPNSPRSTPTRATFAGRALVTPGVCHRLSVHFDGLDAGAALEFPQNCRDASGVSFAWGIAVIAALSALLALRRTRDHIQPSDDHRGGEPT